MPFVRRSSSWDNANCFAVWQVKVHWKDSSWINGEGTVGKILAARAVAEHGVQVQASLGISIVQIVCREQPVTLGPDIAHLQFQISG